jgi:amino acid transporter
VSEPAEGVPAQAEVKHLNVRQAAFIGVGSMVGAGIFALLGAALIIIVMTGVNIMGALLVARAQTVVVYIVLGILSLFAIVTLVNMNPSLLAFSGYPPLKDIVSSVALTFFAFLGFGIITFTARDLAKPSRELPKAMYLALGIATVIYVAIALGVFGTLTVEKVIASGGTALAVAAEPTLGKAGYWLMTVTALFATAGATNAGLYPAVGLCDRLAETGQFPPLMARRLGGRASSGLLIQAAACVVMALVFKLDAIASIGSAVALLIFTLITVAHLRIRGETGANVLILIAAIVAASVVLVTFVFSTLIHEPASIVALVVILVLSIGLDYLWKRSSAGKAKHVQVVH